MGIMKNFEKLKKYKDWKNQDKILKMEIAKSVEADTTFLEEYSAFKTDLLERLNTILIEKNMLEVTIRPHKYKAKYFEAFRTDETIKNFYRVKVTKGGEFVFSIIKFEEYLNDDLEIE